MGRLQKRKLGGIIHILLALQSGLTVVLIVWRFFVPVTVSAYMTDIIFIGVLCVMLGVFYLFWRTAADVRQAVRRDKAQQEIIRNIQELNFKMRAQRHDFLNHIQVIYALLELEDVDAAIEYLNKVYGDIGELNRFIKTRDPAVNALLQAKFNSARDKKIDFSLNVLSALDCIPLPGWELCRVLGNLLDNAFYAACSAEDGGRVKLSVWENVSEYYIEVENNGETVTDANAGKIFTAGFTTKGEAGEGLGLAIVKDILDSCGGRITHESAGEHGITRFRASMKKKQGVQNCIH